MIPNQWYPIFDSGRLRRGRPTGVTRLGRELVLWRRADGSVAALPDRCPHRAARLSRGRIRDDQIACPYHGFRFDGGGRCVLVPANGADAPILDSLHAEPVPVREGHGLVWLWHGEPSAAAPELPWFGPDVAEERVSATLERQVSVHYLRVMENATDVHHFPFVHKTLMPGLGARVIDFEASQRGREIAVRGALVRDGPRPGRRWPFEVHLRLPTLIYFDVFPGLRFLLSATPIDAERTWLWGRYSQRWVPAALGGRQLVRVFGEIDFQVTFLRQDLPTLRSQLVDDPGDISGYHLIEADRGVALFFALRHRLLRDAAGSGIAAA